MIECVCVCVCVCVREREREQVSYDHQKEEETAQTWLLYMSVWDVHANQKQMVVALNTKTWHWKTREIYFFPVDRSKITEPGYPLCERRNSLR